MLDLFDFGNKFVSNKNKSNRRIDSVNLYKDVTKSNRYPVVGDQVIWFNNRLLYAGFVDEVDYRKDCRFRGYVKIQWTIDKPYDYDYWGYSIYSFIVKSRLIRVYRNGIEMT